MGADLFESYVGSIIAAVTLGFLSYETTGIMGYAVAPVILSSFGIIASIIADLFESYVGSIIAAVTLGFLSYETTGIMGYAVAPVILSSFGIIASIIATVTVDQ